MEQIYIPTLHSFAMDNVFTGSWGALRFRIEPQIVRISPKEVNMEESSMLAEYWYGEKCYELSQIEGTEVFPMSAEGREAMQAWLESKIVEKC